MSKSLDRPLPPSKRIIVWMHLQMCRLCSAFRRDQILLKERIAQEVSRESGKEMPQEVTLSAAAKQRITKAMDSQGS
uniref:hypothetical protein n=1 Tax=Allorhodopirellula solitaria TaxID=2527987 RepID=UPI0011B7AC9B|nr:hypothetical protein [Allorhodopirellula solitaria]